MYISMLATIFLEFRKSFKTRQNMISVENASVEFYPNIFQASKVECPDSKLQLNSNSDRFSGI